MEGSNKKTIQSVKPMFQSVWSGRAQQTPERWFYWFYWDHAWIFGLRHRQDIGTSLGFERPGVRKCREVPMV